MVQNLDTRASRKTGPCVEGFRHPVVMDKGVERRAKFAYALRFRTASFANVDPQDSQGIEAFNRLLESTIDPSESLNVEHIHRGHIKQVFRTQPYMTKRRKSTTMKLEIESVVESS
jgi:hypothetical protein